MTLVSRRWYPLSLASLVLPLAAASLALPLSGCAGPAEAARLEVTYYYLPG